MAANGGAGAFDWCTRAACYTTKRTNTAAPCSLSLRAHPQDLSRRIFRCFRHTSRCLSNGQAKPLDWKYQGRGIGDHETRQVRWPAVARLTGLTVTP
jgi:hypothetical protein